MTQRVKLQATDLETTRTSELRPEIDGRCDFVFETEDTENVIIREEVPASSSNNGSDRFPIVEPTSEDLNSQCRFHRLNSMIDRVIFCAARDELRNLNSVYWEDGYLRLVAADGFRMALSEERN